MRVLSRKVGTEKDSERKHGLHSLSTLVGKGKEGKELSELKDHVAQNFFFFNMTMNHPGFQTERTGSTAKF